MTRAIQVAHFILLVTLILGVASGIWAGFFYVPQIGSRTLTALDGINGVLATVNRPKSGTLAQINGAAEDARRVMIPIGKAAIHEQHQLDTIDGLVQRTGSDLHLALGSLTDAAKAGAGTASALTGTALQTTADLKTANDSIASLRPLVEAGTATVKDADAIVTNPAIPLMLEDIQDVAAHTDSITGDTAKVTAHFEKIIDAPKKRTFWGTVKQGWQIMWQIGMLAK